MNGLLALAAAASVALAPPSPVENDVQIGQGVAALHGSLLRPAHAEPGAAVLLITGSGTEDRNGDDLQAGQKSQAMRLLARGLAEQGIISLRFDKRGVGESTSAGVVTSVETLANDAVGWAKLLRQQPDVRCVVILGHSEGALVATLAAHKVRICGLILVSGTSLNLGDLIESQDALAGRSAATDARVHQIIQALRSGRTVSDVPPELAGVFATDTQAYTISEINIEPVAELTKVRVPVLVLQGDNDLQASVDDAKRLAAASGAKLVVIAGMNHILKIAPSQMVGNFMTYMNPNLPLAPGVIPAVAGFVRARR
jgi:pimeloyl-ACP methyl ester carboxylesterase